MSMILETIWNYLRERVADIDDELYELHRFIEEEIPSLSKKEADKLRQFSKTINAAGQDLDDAWKLVCRKTGPSLPEWFGELEKKARRISNKAKREGRL